MWVSRFGDTEECEFLDLVDFGCFAFSEETVTSLFCWGELLSKVLVGNFRYSFNLKTTKMVMKSVFNMVAIRIMYKSLCMRECACVCVCVCIYIHMQTQTMAGPLLIEAVFCVCVCVCVCLCTTSITGGTALFSSIPGRPIVVLVYACVYSIYNHTYTRIHTHTQAMPGHT